MRLAQHYLDADTRRDASSSICPAVVLFMIGMRSLLFQSSAQVLEAVVVVVSFPPTVVAFFCRDLRCFFLTFALSLRSKEPVSGLPCG